MVSPASSLQGCLASVDHNRALPAAGLGPHTRVRCCPEVIGLCRNARLFWNARLFSGQGRDAQQRPSPAVGEDHRDAGPVGRLPGHAAAQEQVAAVQPGVHPHLQRPGRLLCRDCDPVPLAGKAVHLRWSMSDVSWRHLWDVLTCHLMDERNLGGIQVDLPSIRTSCAAAEGLCKSTMSSCWALLRVVWGFVVSDASALCHRPTAPSSGSRRTSSVGRCWWTTSTAAQCSGRCRG